MRDSEIRESIDPLRVLQKIKEKQNEELITLTLEVPQIEGIEKKDPIVVTATKTSGCKLSIKFIYKNFIIFDFICY